MPTLYILIYRSKMLLTLRVQQEQIHEAYQKRFNVEGLQLKHKGAIVDPSDLLNSFQTSGDNLLLFLATYGSRPERNWTTPPSRTCEEDNLKVHGEIRVERERE
ncbi:hypothetical protein T440DRAFT_475255 [Plenodomus tracheiphilus IPT5]|uniref:Uncharacterized protein n=1 Tax=Plenodomus tracheiphilus IPT5 TaxID=1408161 RepID=A0A6A7BHC0_9PLEO|nr:hypothetical protein T440DRAFT_475255 [Plenodomus tracheiphilus IPT5]